MFFSRTENISQLKFLDLFVAQQLERIYFGDYAFSDTARQS